MNQRSAIPFIRAACDVFDTMLSLEVEPGTPTAKQSGDAAHDLSGVVRFTGDVEGDVILSFPEATAHRVCAIFAGADCSENQEDLHDAIGELTSMIAGSAKAQFKNKKVSINCPTVVVGTAHAPHARQDAPRILIPFNSDCGEFTLEYAVTGLDSTTNATEPAAVTSH